MSKGDTYRPVDKKKFDKNWERIFNHKPKADDEQTMPHVRGEENPGRRRKRK